LNRTNERIVIAGAIFCPLGLPRAQFGSVVGAFLLTVAYLAWRQRFIIYSNGFVAVRALGRNQLSTWSEISEIIERNTGSLEERQCLFVKRDGTRILLNEALFPRTDRIMDMLRKLADERGLPWKKQDSGLTHFRWKGRLLAWFAYGVIAFGIAAFIFGMAVLAWTGK
jgi:hypothetical protein